MIKCEIIEADSIIEGLYDKPLYDKFIEAYRVEDFEVLTPNGYVNIEGVGKTIEYNEWFLVTSGDKDIICADKHILYVCENIEFDKKKCDITEKFCIDCKVGDWIMTKDGPEEIIIMTETGRKSNMYDLQISDGSNKQYYTNNILSHNSLWMQNFAVRSADLGHNVLYITLEMSERKVMKRLGSMRLKIPINDYDKISNDRDYIKKRIESIYNSQTNGDIFNKKIGKIYTKFFPSGAVTINTIDNYIENLIDKKDLKLNLIIVDYLTLIAPVKGIGADSLFTKGKHLAEGLRGLAHKYSCPFITGVQITKDSWNSTDITLDSVPESKAIADTSDTFFAIIRTEEMKRNGIYRFKLLKQRDGDFLKSQIRLDLNTKFLTLENDQFLDQ